jgi:hypothetical protein
MQYDTYPPTLGAREREGQWAGGRWGWADKKGRRAGTGGKERKKERSTPVARRVLRGHELGSGHRTCLCLAIQGSLIL